MVMPMRIPVMLISALMLLIGCDSQLGHKRVPAYSPLPPMNQVQQEISDVAELPYERDRRERLYAIAQRENLDSATQARLVEAALNTLSDDEDREKVLIALIENPSFSKAARDYIQRNLDVIDYPAIRFRVTQAIADRGSLSQ